MCRLAAGVAALIRIDALWLATAPIDMRAGTERLLARVVQVFGSAQAHHGYLFANARGSRIKLLVHDGCGARQSRDRPNAATLSTRVVLDEQFYENERVWFT